MMNQDDINFLLMIRDYVKNRPEVAAHIADYAQQGLNDHIDSLYTRLGEMETIALVACSKRFDGAEELIIDKIKSIKHKTCFKWDGFLEDMQGIIDKRKKEKK